MFVHQDHIALGARFGRPHFVHFHMAALALWGALARAQQEAQGRALWCLGRQVLLVVSVLYLRLAALLWSQVECR